MKESALSVGAIAADMGVSEATVRVWISRGDLPAYKLPGSSTQPIIRVKRQDYDRWLESRRTVLDTEVGVKNAH
jgi:excisionase family DNA binding protein